MKRKMTITLICISFILQMTACGAVRPTASDLEKRKEQAREEIASHNKENTRNKENESTDHKEAEGSFESGKADEAAVDEGDLVSGVRFGSADAKGYRGFTYLTEERISTTKTTSKKEAAFSVYLPKEDHPRVSGASARSERAGVYVKVDLEPYLQYKAKEYSLRSNLQKYVDGEMAYYDNYYDISIGEIQEMENGVVCEVSYMEYDSWNEEYIPHYAAYALYQLADDVLALVTVTVNEEDTTQETELLMAELDSFYELQLGWNRDFARDKQAEFEDRYSGNQFEVYSLAFTLPDDWAIDEEMTDDYETIIAPGGDSELADDCLAIMSPDVAYGIVDTFLEDIEMMEEIWEEDLEDESDYVEIEDMGITFLGRTIKMTIVEHYDDDADAGVIYIAEDDDNMYMIYGYTRVDTKNGEEAVMSENLTEAIEMFFETGRVTDGMM